MEKIYTQEEFDKEIQKSMYKCILKSINTKKDSVDAIIKDIEDPNSVSNIPQSAKVASKDHVVSKADKLRKFVEKGQKGVHTQLYSDKVGEQGQSVMGSAIKSHQTAKRWENSSKTAKASFKEMKDLATQESKRTLNEMKSIRPKLPKSEENG